MPQREGLQKNEGAAGERGQQKIGGHRGEGAERARGRQRRTPPPARVCKGEGPTEERGIPGRGVPGRGGAGGRGLQRREGRRGERATRERVPQGRGVGRGEPAPPAPGEGLQGRGAAQAAGPSGVPGVRGSGPPPDRAGAELWCRSLPWSLQALLSLIRLARRPSRGAPGEPTWSSQLRSSSSRTGPAASAKQGRPAACTGGWVEVEDKTRRRGRVPAFSALLCPEPEACGTQTG